MAYGINIGTNRLSDQVKLVLNTLQLPTDYYLPPNAPSWDMIPSKCGKKVIKILLNHCFFSARDK